MSYIPKYFKAYELVPRDVYNVTHTNDIFDLFDENALKVIDLIREWSGVPLVINNWYSGGNRENSGYRKPDSKVGAQKSSHKLGKAFDIISSKKTTKELWAIINKNADKLPCKIRIEKTSNGREITWLHIDTAAKTNQTQQVYYFNA